MLVEFECPKCKGHMADIQSRTQGSLVIRLAFWHMILNPGLAINELLLGQKFPSTLYNCKSCEVPLNERSYLHCPDCNTFHSGMIWAGKNAFRHWLGLFCPDCGSTIPCDWNIFSRLLLAITAPIWWFPVKQERLELKSNALKRIETAKGELLTKGNEPVNFNKIGWQYGLYMYIASVVVFPPLMSLAHGNFDLSTMLITAGINLILGPIVWLPAGWLFGRMMKLAVDRKGDSNLHIAINEDGTVLPALPKVEDMGNQSETKTD